MFAYADERTVLLIDGANLFSAARTLGYDIDYKKLLERTSQQCRLIRAYYYTAILENDDYSPLRPLVDWLDYNGFRVVTKAAREFTDQNGRRRVKGKMDVELTVDALELAPHVDHYVLFTGDGDYHALVKALQNKGKRVSVVSTVKTRPPMIADDLRRQADHFLELADLMKEMGRERRDDREDDRAPRKSRNDDEYDDDDFDDYD